MPDVAYDFQVTVDCERPHELADWWARTLGWAVSEQDPDFIRRMIAQGYATEAETATHHGRLVWAEGAAIHHPEQEEGRGPRPRVLFQRVPEPKTVKNRMHLDIHVGADNVEAEIAKLTERGATYLHRSSQGPHTWVTMADPEGNEFCIT